MYQYKPNLYVVILFINCYICWLQGQMNYLEKQLKSLRIDFSTCV